MITNTSPITLTACPVCEQPVRSFDRRCNQCSSPLTVAPHPVLCSCGLRMQQASVVEIDGARFEVWQCPHDGAQSFRAAALWSQPDRGAA